VETLWLCRVEFIERDEHKFDHNAAEHDPVNKDHDNPHNIQQHLPASTQPTRHQHPLTNPIIHAVIDADPDRVQVMRDPQAAVVTPEAGHVPHLRALPHRERQREILPEMCVEDVVFHPGGGDGEDAG